MNFDDMKSAWKSDPGKNVVIPETLDKIKSIGMPVEKIRKLLLGEFFVQVPVIILFYFSPSVFPIAPRYELPFYFLYVVFILICIYYFLKFYLFYKRLNKLTLNSKDNLYTVYYDIQLNIEMYKSFTYTISPFVLVYAYMHLSNRLTFDIALIYRSTGNNYVFIFLAAAITVFSVILTFVLTEYYVKKSYGKYAAQIKTVLDELREN